MKCAPVEMCWGHWLFVSVGKTEVSLVLRWMYHEVCSRGDVLGHWLFVSVGKTEVSLMLRWMYHEVCSRGDVLGALALCICREDRGVLGAEMDVPRSVLPRGCAGGIGSLYLSGRPRCHWC